MIRGGRAGRMAIVLIMLIFSAASTLWSRKRAPRFLLNWTLQGAATGYAAKSIISTYVTNVRKIRELSQTPDSDEPATLRRGSSLRSRPSAETPDLALPSDVADEHAPDRGQATTRRSPGRPLPRFPVRLLRRPRRAGTCRTPRRSRPTRFPHVLSLENRASSPPCHVGCGGVTPSARRTPVPRR